MRILFLHPSFPAQFHHRAAVLASDPNHQVVFGTMRPDGELPGVRKVYFNIAREVSPHTHHYVRPLENAVLHGQAVYRLGQALLSEGFTPDLVFAHAGWGLPLFVKDIFPKTRLLCYCEWFYRARGADADFNPTVPLQVDDELRLRVKNAAMLIDLANCDRALTPTRWQHHQFPPDFQSKISVIPDGVDTEFFQPEPEAKLALPTLDLDLSNVSELVTYVSPGLEPYKGFPQLMQAIALLQRRRPDCHAVIVGEDRTIYSKPLPDGKTYKQAMLESLPLDRSRIHFTGPLSYREYLQVLQASSVHIYLTYPYILSRSLLEAMSTGCAIVASQTAPVMEVIRDGVNGLLVDFFSPQAIADRVDEALSQPDKMTLLKANARKTIEEQYDLRQLLPKQVQWVFER
ncbi:glycosyltransferase family 4 protein [Leptodesmis sichuanensis]|uniref:glycosyltransferase family 4 protein n=1 Tax=Leptodesmis sichuanensis TaxID=2906798 RepID=UPI001F2D2336|nr:glycosyltransferase family 4 protein [Leptodesmis sichuanensis]UIE35930.1 glycosyltransferase family 4 protein [Leptodesmis sichuanensis A121]